MLDSAARESAPFKGPALSALQFLSIEVLPTADGLLCVSLTGTYVDESKLEFINDDIESVRVSSLDEALAVIRRGLGEALGLGALKKGH